MKYKIEFTKIITSREKATREFELPDSANLEDIAAWARIQGTKEGGGYTAMALYFSDFGEEETEMHVVVTPVAEEPLADADFDEVEPAPPPAPAPATAYEELF